MLRCPVSLEPAREMEQRPLPGVTPPTVTRAYFGDASLQGMKATRRPTC